jgi:hypothetical protein
MESSAKLLFLGFDSRSYEKTIKDAEVLDMRVTNIVVRRKSAGQSEHFPNACSTKFRCQGPWIATGRPMLLRQPGSKEQVNCPSNL